MKVKDIMTKSLVVANIDNTISDVSKMMKEYDIGFIPVKDKKDYVGVITDRDIVTRIISKEIGSNNKIGKYITKFTIAISSDADIDEALELMGEEKIKRLLVDEKRKIVGILSLSDILSIQGDNYVLKCISKIFSPFGKPLTENDINLIEAEIDEFDL
jgi:Predicted signal-transduction protein containing cAMP-binding and CBS domains